MVRPLAPIAAMVMLTACTTSGLYSQTGTTRAAALPDTTYPITTDPDATPSDSPLSTTETHADGTCWAREKTPAVYEQVLGEVQVVQADIAEDGTVLRPPIYRKGQVPRLVQPRGEVTFEAPCPDQMTPEFIDSVQRALAARNYYSGNITGRLDAPTTAAILTYQTERGLESDQLSLETARALGLIAVELPDT